MLASFSLLNSIPREALLLGLCIPVCLAVGFACGLLYERWYQANQLQRLTRRFEKLFAYVASLLEKSEQACQALSHACQIKPLSQQQQGKLQQFKEHLTAHFNKLVGTASTDTAESATSSRDQNLKKMTLGQNRWPVWSRESVDSRTGLPDAVAFDQNLSIWLNRRKNSVLRQGLLFLQMDDFHKQSRRFGAAVADHFLQQISSCTLKQLREADLLCQISDDVLIACLPDTEEAELTDLAHRVRSAIRQYRFLQPGQQQPVYITASFGCMCFLPDELDDPLPLIEQRRLQVLSASRKKGRCCLHKIDSAGHPLFIAG